MQPQTIGPSLVFLGGIKDSGKSDLADQLGKLPGFFVTRVSDHLRGPLKWPVDRPLSAAVVYVDWKYKAEEAAVVAMCEEALEFRRTKDLKTLVINSHFATYSPSGFMMGLGPESLRKICEKFCLNTTSQVAVVLVDISIADVLARREHRWMQQTDDFPTGPGLAADLEFNRLYSVQYYNCLAALLPKRAHYYRAVVNYRGIKDLSEELAETDAFRVAYRELTEFLKSLSAGQRV